MRRNNAVHMMKPFAAQTPLERTFIFVSHSQTLSDAAMVGCKEWERGSCAAAAQARRR
jgi:hypothetical protein